ncbi:hypothetical protein GCM10027028_66290 [Streptomyces sundarbansensis]
MVPCLGGEGAKPKAEQKAGETQEKVAPVSIIAQVFMRSTMIGT